MKKIVISCALLLLSLSSHANAGESGAITLALDGQCDVFNLQFDKGVATITENHNVGCGTKYGVGVSGADLTHRFGRAMVFSVQDAAKPGVVYLYEFSYPLFLGGTWHAYATTDGKTFEDAGSGTYQPTK